MMCKVLVVVKAGLTACLFPSLPGNLHAKQNGLADFVPKYLPSVGKLSICVSIGLFSAIQKNEYFM